MSDDERDRIDRLADRVGEVEVQVAGIAADGKARAELLTEVREAQKEHAASTGAALAEIRTLLAERKADQSRSWTPMGIAAVIGAAGTAVASALAAYTGHESPPSAAPAPVEPPAVVAPAPEPTP